VAALSAATQCYVRLLGALAARGLEKHPAETPLEFCRRVAPRLDAQAQAVARATALYHQARFSGRALASGELDREIDSVIAALASGTDPSRVRAE
jgi:hypothetical protein